MTEQTTEASATPPRTLAIVSVVLAVGLLVAVVLVRFLGGSTPVAPAASTDMSPYGVVPVTAPQATSAECATLLKAMPAALESNGAKLVSRSQATPKQDGVLLWGAGTEPVSLRCGLPQPDELKPTSELAVTNGVQWLAIKGDTATTYYVVDRAVYAALTIPDSVTGTGPITQASNVVAKALPNVGIHIK